MLGPPFLILGGIGNHWIDTNFCLTAKQGSATYFLFRNAVKNYSSNIFYNLLRMHRKVNWCWKMPYWPGEITIQFIGRCFLHMTQRTLARDHLQRE